MTTQATFLSKRVDVGNTTVNLAIWDTAGQERYHSLSPIYYRNADGALLVFDITDLDSFEKAKKWVKELRQFVGTIPIVIAGNKKDLVKIRAVETDMAKSYAESVGAVYVETSAKSGDNVNLAFTSLAQKMLDASTGPSPSNPSESQPSTTAGRPRNVITIAYDEPQPTSSGCSC
ncbi:hypothetical protein RCL1_004453 [Eukaryota sp. TZLM3-RCL]